MFDEKEILRKLPSQLRNDVLLDMYENVLRNMPFVPELDTPQGMPDLSWE
eukprot:SAG31_NODE_8646_length_1414_cov_1.787833_3_plen_49_part_01